MRLYVSSAISVFDIVVVNDFFERFCYSPCIMKVEDEEAFRCYYYNYDDPFLTSFVMDIRFQGTRKM